MTDKPKSPVEEAARSHYDVLREGGLEEWDSQLQESAIYGQAEFSFKLGAKWLAGELIKEDYSATQEVTREIKRLMGEANE